MKLPLLALFLCGFIGIQAQEITKKPDFIQKGEKGEILLRGVYTTDDAGYVIRYDLFDAEGSLTKTTIPFYTRDGRLLEARDYDASGKLMEVVVIIGDRAVGLAPDGKKIEKYDAMKVDMEGFLEHFRSSKE